MFQKQLCIRRIFLIKVLIFDFEPVYSGLVRFENTNESIWNERSPPMSYCSIISKMAGERSWLGTILRYFSDAQWRLFLFLRWNIHALRASSCIGSASGWSESSHLWRLLWCGLISDPGSWIRTWRRQSYFLCKQCCQGFATILMPSILMWSYVQFLHYILNMNIWTTFAGLGVKFGELSSHIRAWIRWWCSRA